MNIFHPRTTNNLMYESQLTDLTQSYQASYISKFIKNNFNCSIYKKITFHINY